MNYRKHPKEFFRFGKDESNCYATCSKDTGIVVELGASNLLGRDLDRLIDWILRAQIFRVWLAKVKHKSKAKSTFPRELYRSNLLQMVNKKNYNFKQQRSINAVFDQETKRIKTLYAKNPTIYELDLLLDWLQRARKQQKSIIR
jgi:hypothetical protein